MNNGVGIAGACDPLPGRVTSPIAASTELKLRGAVPSCTHA
jgi:hypothetical protein